MALSATTDALAGAIIYRRLMTHEPTDDPWVERHVDRMLAAFSRSVQG